MNATTRAGDVYLMYLRKSRADFEKEARGEFETLAKHEHQLTEMAQAMGLMVGRVYREIVTGESIAERTEFQAVMREVMERRCAGVIVHAIDRLGRGDMMEYGWVLSTFQYTGALIVTPGRVYDPSNQSDMQLLQLQMFFANTELATIKRRLREGREQAAREGEYIGTNAPFGYDKAKVDRRKTLAPNGDAPVVAQIFQQAAEGKTCADIAHDLNARNVPAPIAEEWRSHAVKRIIRNPVYCGRIRYNNYKQQIVGRDGMEYRKVRRRTADEREGLIIVPGLHPPIVDDELWEAANKTLGPAPKQHVEKGVLNPLASLMVCAKCGYTMRLKFQPKRDGSGGKYRYFSHATNPQGCTCRMTAYDAVMDALAEGLAKIARDAEMELEDSGRQAAIAQEATAVEKKLAAESRKLDALIELYSEGALTIDEFARRRDSYRANVEKLEDRLKSLHAEKPEDHEATRLRVMTALSALQDPDKTPAEINAALRSVISRIEFENLTKRKNDQRINLTVYLR